MAVVRCPCALAWLNVHLERVSGERENSGSLLPSQTCSTCTQHSLREHSTESFRSYTCLVHPLHPDPHSFWVVQPAYSQGSGAGLLHLSYRSRAAASGTGQRTFSRTWTTRRMNRNVYHNLTAGVISTGISGKDASCTTAASRPRGHETESRSTPIDQQPEWSSL